MHFGIWQCNCSNELDIYEFMRFILFAIRIFEECEFNKVIPKFRETKEEKCNYIELSLKQIETRYFFKRSI